MSIPKTPAEANRHEWRHVPVGACIRLKSGIWHVTDRCGDVITMHSAANGQSATGAPHPGELVTVLQPGDPLYVPHPDDVAAERRVEHLSDQAKEALASALVQTMLGGHVIAVRDLGDPTAPQQCPPVAGMPAHYLAAHLYHFHRLEREDVLDLASPPELVVLHALHDSRRDLSPHRHQDS